MRVNILADEVHLHFALPRFLYLNGFAVSVLSLFRPAGISPHQARKSLRSVKNAMREYHLSNICEFSVIVSKNSEEPSDDESAAVRVNIDL